MNLNSRAASIRPGEAGATLAGIPYIIGDMRPHRDKTNHHGGPGDDSFGETDEVSRSQRRREALDVLHLAQQLTQLSDAQLRLLPLGDELLEEVQRARAVKQQIAHKRQTQYLAKQLRKLEADQLDAIRAALEHDRVAARRQSADLHRIETWRDRLIAEGDDALGALVTEFPHADRQLLRQLARQVRVERESGKPPHAFRELFRVLRGMAQA